jgi:hypothetical protein
MSRFNFSCLRLFLLTWALFLQLGKADAQEIHTCEVHIVTPDGRPVPDAIIVPGAINKQYFWPWDQLPATPKKSNEEGLAAIRYPAHAYPEKIQVESITMSVSHADYCRQNVVVPVDPSGKPFEIILKPGIEFSIDAVDEDGNPVPQPFAVMFAKSVSGGRFHRPQPHLAQCRSIESGNQQIMLVQPGDSGLHRFSEVITYRFDAEKEPVVTIQDVEIRPGISVRGKLHPDVPRPVMNGQVVAVHVPLPAGDSWDEALPSLLYYDSVTIDEDGTFEFASMPHTGTIQLIALCDGWVGLQDEEFPFIVGETFEVNDESLEVELEMKPTFDAVIRVVDKSGQPVEGVTVAGSPNQLYRKGGSTILGQQNSSMAGLKGQCQEIPGPSYQRFKNRFQGVSDENGKVIIRNLPRNRWATRFGVWSEDKQSTKVKMNEELEGKLPDDGQQQVEFDLIVEREIPQP